MKTVYRILSILIIIVCVVGILVSLAAIGLAWAYNTPVTETLTNILSEVQSRLSVMINLLDRTDQVATQVLDLVSEVKSRVEQVQTNIAGSRPVIAILSALVGENISPKVNQAWETLVGIRNSAAALNTTIQTFNALPFVNIPRIAEGTQEIENLFNDIINAVNDLERFTNDLKTGVNEALVLPVLDTINELERLLSEVQVELQLYNDQLTTIDNALTELITRLPRTIDMISFAITLVFGWLILAQSGLVYLSIGLFRTGSLALAQPATIAVIEPESQMPSDDEVFPDTDEPEEAEETSTDMT